MVVQRLGVCVLQVVSCVSGDSTSFTAVGRGGAYVGPWVWMSLPMKTFPLDVECIPSGHVPICSIAGSLP